MPCGGHVGGRVAELAAALVALDDLAAHGERVAERLGGAVDVAGEPGRCGRTSRTTPAGRRRAAMPSATKSWSRPELGAACRRRRRPWRRTGSSRRPRRRGRAARRPGRRATNSLGGPGGHIAVERQHSTSSAPAASSSAARRLERGQRGRGVLGAQHRHRVRVERHRHDRQRRQLAATSRARPTTCWWPRWTPSKLPTVTTVRPRSAGHVVERAPDLHGGLLLSAIRRR